MIEHEIEELLLGAVVLGEDAGFAGGDAIASRNRLGRVGDVGQHIIEIAIFSINEAADFGELLVAVAPFGESFEEGLTGVGLTPELAQFGLIFEQVGDVAEKLFDEFGGGDGFTFGTPKAGLHRVLKGALFAVGEPDKDLLGTARRCGFVVGVVSGSIDGVFASRFADTTRDDWFGLLRFTVPFGVVEVLVGLHEVVDGEVVFAFKGAGAASDDLLELDDGADHSQQDDVTDVAGIDAGGELLGGGEDSGDGFLVVLKGAQVLFAEAAVVGGDADAVVGVGADFVLIDQVADGQGVVLGGAEHQGLFILVNHPHEELNPVAFALFDFDDAVEVGFGVDAIALHFSFQHVIVGAVEVFVEGGFDLPHFEGGEEAVVDAVFEGVSINGLAEVGIGVSVVFPFGGSGEAELHRWREVFQNGAPGALVFSPAPVAFVDDDEVEEVGGIIAKVGGGVARLVFARHEGLKDGEEDTTVFGHAAPLFDGVRVDANQGIVGEGGEGVVGLVGKDVAIGQEQNARAASGFAAEVPAALKEFPGELEGDEGFAGAGSHGQQNSVTPFANGLQHMLNGVVLIVAGFPGAAAVFKGDVGEAIAPRIRFAVGGLPEIVGGGVLEDSAFGPGTHVDLVNADAVGGVGEAGFELLGVVFGLADAFGDGGIALFGFDYGEFVAAIDEHVVGIFGVGAAAITDEATGGDDFAANAATLDEAPASSAEGGVNEFGTGFGFVHRAVSLEMREVSSAESYLNSAFPLLLFFPGL